MFKQLFLIKPVKGDKYQKNRFSPQSEPHTAKLYLSVVLKFFWEIHRELLFLVRKVATSETAIKYRKFVFLTKFQMKKS